ncbi:hypothetical protein PybrP1_009017 [[Pythium] brassicae (nom. inval.)]|nr:hypothetical protein PybrP1_009017 [[Pythium] brassicae (nom. inval.)]
MMSVMRVPATAEDALAVVDGGDVFEVPPAKQGEWPTVSRKRIKFSLLYGGRTPNAIHHLSTDRNIRAHETQLTGDNRWTRQDEIEHLEAASMFNLDKVRQYRLLATRMIVFNNVPYKPRVMMKKSFSLTLETTDLAQHEVGLYAAAKKVTISNLNKARVEDATWFTMVVKFWTSKTQAMKYLVMRVYFVDED